MLTFLQLPVDILFLVLYELTPNDLIRISATCKLLYEISNDRTVWFQRINDIQTRLPFLSRDRPNLLSSTADKLKQEGVRQSLLDDRWSKTGSPPGNIRHLDCGSDINFFTLFPGGEWLVVIFQDGRFCLKELNQPPGGTTPRSVTVDLNGPVQDVMHNFWTSRSADGSAVLSMSQYYGSNSCMHFYRISPTSLSITYLGNKLLPRCRWASPVRNYPEDENMLACLHLGVQPQTMQLTLLLLPTSTNPKFVCRTKAIFNLGEFVSQTMFGIEEDLFSICIPYTHLLIVTHGSYHIRIYELPPLDTLYEEENTVPIQVPIIWEWTSQDGNAVAFHFEQTLLIPHIPCQRAHLQACSQRLIYILAEDSLTLHCLFLSVSSQPDKHSSPYRTVVKHHIHRRSRNEVTGNSYLALRSYRGAWLSGDPDHHLTFETISFKNVHNPHHSCEVYSSDKDGYPLAIGSFSVDTGLPDPYLMDWDFDEVSGRFCLLVVTNDPFTKSVCLVDRAST